MGRYQKFISDLEAHAGQRKKREPTRGGKFLDDPKYVAPEDEFKKVELVVSTKGGDEGNMSTVLTPAVFRFMQSKGWIRKLPHEIEFLSKFHEKERGECFKVATNPNFVQLPEDFKYGSQYSALEQEGDGYRVSNQGKVQFPVVYFVSSNGWAIACTREYLRPLKAKVHLENGTADILGMRTIELPDKNLRAVYFIRRYTVLSCSTDRHGYRVVGFRHYNMSRHKHMLPLAHAVLTAFVGRRPKGCIAQHDGERYDNSIENLRWIPLRENNLKENIDPQ